MKTAGLAGIQRPTLEILADQTLPTDEQKAAILIYDRAALDCATERARVYATGGGDYLAVHTRAVSLSQAARADLYQGKISFGEHARRIDAIAQDVGAAFASIDRQREQMDIQRRQAAAAEMGATAATMSVLQQAYQPAPLTIQPIQMPSTIRCTSQQIGAYTYTNCR